MRPLPPLRPRTARLLVGLAATAALLLPAAAAAAATPGTDDGADGGAPCPDALVTFTRAATVGDDQAVALTAQSVERDTEGWEMVGWETAAGTQLSAVVATDRDGAIHRLGVAVTGVAEEVVSLTFCGTAAEHAERGADDADQPAPNADDADQPAPNADDADQPAPSADDDSSAVEVSVEPDPSHDAAAGDTEATTEEPAPARTQAEPDESPAPADEPGDAADHAARPGTDDTADQAADDAEVEVLGVRIVATPEEDDDATSDAAPERDVRGGATSEVEASAAGVALAADDSALDRAWLLAAAVAAAIAAGIAVSTQVRRVRRATTTANTHDRTPEGGHR